MTNLVENQNYIIEGNLDFYNELYKSLDDEDSDENNLCSISGYPLNDTSIKLECGHLFNYIPLYKEIIKQKFTFKTYTNETLSIKNQQKLKLSTKNYYIKCPYCREIQFTLLPYDEKIGVSEIYSINSNDPLLQGEMFKLLNENKSSNYNGVSFFKYGVNFTYSNNNICLYKDSDLIICNNHYTCCIPTTNNSFCSIHYFPALKKHNNNIKKEAKNQEKIKQKEIKIQEKLKKIEEKLKQKEENKKKLVEEKQSKLVEINKERVKNGLKPKLSNSTNYVIKLQSVNIYTPLDDDIIEDKDESLFCQGIIKSGINKGKQCCKKGLYNSFCKIHLPKCI